MYNCLISFTWKYLSTNSAKGVEEENFKEKLKKTKQEYSKMLIKLQSSRMHILIPKLFYSVLPVMETKDRTTLGESNFFACVRAKPIKYS